jgi:GH15 family glucan-1,4-alpha-glucosidase
MNSSLSHRVGRKNVSRTDGYAPIRDYAAIGDQRTIALVARDGSIDWLPLPTLASPPALGALVDAQRGGRFVLQPDEGFEVERRYVPETNVLETTYRGATGAVRVTDAVTTHTRGPLPWFELVRRLEGLSGELRLRWELDVRFPLGGGEHTNIELLRFGVAGDENPFVVRDGERALLALVAVENQPLPRPERDEIERRLDETADVWRTWIRDHDYDGPWHDAVTRSALVLKLLTYEPTGGIVAAPTTSLPERLGGDSNWDYRFCWVRDSAYTLDALLALGRREDAHASFAWLLDRIATTAPDIRPLYPLAAGPPVAERTVPVEGYRGSQPVRTGNDAAKQTQLGVYGDLLDTAWRYVNEGNSLDETTRGLIVTALDTLASRWREPDCGFWEIRGGARHYTHSKLSALIAFDRAVRLALDSQLPNDDAPRWVRAQDEIERFVESRCWSEQLGSYRFYADVDKLDTTTLLAYRRRIPQRATERLEATIATIRRELGAGGSLLYRHTDAVGEEGAFVASSFWLADALARARRLDEAADVMHATVGLANDVGLFSEEIDPTSRAFLGNFPQGLSHLALIQAAAAIAAAVSSPRS